MDYIYFKYIKLLSHVYTKYYHKNKDLFLFVIMDAVWRTVDCQVCQTFEIC